MRSPLLIAVVCVAAIAGCGETDEETSVACLEGASIYLDALRATPAVVRLDSETPISDCLPANQSGGDLAEVGTAMLSAATELNAEAREEPGGTSNLQLGYLLGAAQRGAADTEGIHAELIRRLAAAARYSPDNQPLSPLFTRTYREGFDAGRARG